MGRGGQGEDKGTEGGSPYLLFVNGSMQSTGDRSFGGGGGGGGGGFNMSR